MEQIISVGNIIKDTTTMIRYRVIDIFKDMVSLCEMDISSLKITDHNLEVLINLISDNVLIPESDNDDYVLDTSKLNSSVKEKYENNCCAVHEIVNLFRGNYAVFSSKKPKPELYRILEKYSIPKSNFWRMIVKYFQSGMKDVSLVDSKIYGNSKSSNYHYAQKTGAKTKYTAPSGIIITDEIKSIFDEALKEYRSGRQKTLTGCYNKMNLLHFRRTEMINGTPSITLLPISERPTYKQFVYYANNHISFQEKDAIKTSAQEQRNNKRLITSDSLFDVSGPGDMVEIDACEADVSLVSSFDPNKTIGRPIVYFMIDVYSRMILAVSVAFDNNSYLGVSNLFLNLADDKQDYCNRYGMGFDNKDMWQSNIIPRRLRVDRGSEFKGKEFDRLCNELGIEKQLVPGASGSLKGIVEQSFHQMHSKQNSHLEDYGLIEKRYDSEHHKEATLNIEQYTKMVINFVLTHNQEYDSTYSLTKDMISKKIEPIPCLLWKYGISKYGAPRPITNKQQYFYNLMIPVNAKLNRRGICYKNLYYLTDTDPILLKEMFKAGTKKVPFEARMDMRDIGHIYYLRDGKLIDAPLNRNLTGNADYDGLTMKQYEEYLSAKKQMDAEGKIYNQELAAYNYSVNAAITDGAKKKTYSDAKNMRPTREIEKQSKSHKEKISSRIKKEPVKTIPQSEIKENAPKDSTPQYTDFNDALNDYWNED